MKRDYKTLAEWKKAYIEKEELLRERGFEEVSPMDFYRELFPEGSFQKKGVFEKGKPNGICTTMIEEKSGRKFVNISIMTDELDAIKDFSYPKKKPKFATTQKLSLIAPCSFYGKHKSKAMMHELFAMVIDIDYVGKQQLKNLLKQFSNGSRAIPPTYLVSSGRGIHLYYFLEEPLPMYHYYEEKLSELKKDLIRWTWNETSSIKPQEKDMAGVSQAFRSVGSETKLGVDFVTKAFRITGERYTVQQIADWIGSSVDVSPESARTEYRKKHVPLDKAKELYPEWYQETVVEGKKKNGQWTCKRALYDWWIRKIKEEAKVGGRYYCIMALASYGAKCGIPEKEIRRDAFSLVECLEALTDDEANHFSKKDVKDALKAYYSKDEKLTFRHTRAHIAETTKIPIPPNKLNGRKQAEHLHAEYWINEKGRRVVNVCKQNRELALLDMRDNGEIKGRPSEEHKVQEWQQSNPGKRKADCIRETGLSKKTVYKWWKE